MGNVKKWRDSRLLVSHPGAVTQSVDTRTQQLEIARRLRATRQALGLTQADLADRIGVGRTAYTNWEKGLRMPDILAISRMADQFGVTLDWIYRGDMAGLRHSLAMKLEPAPSSSSQAGKAAS